jgi:hypothetical protein
VSRRSHEYWLCGKCSTQFNFEIEFFNVILYSFLLQIAGVRGLASGLSKQRSTSNGATEQRSPENRIDKGLNGSPENHIDKGLNDGKKNYHFACLAGLENSGF